MKKLLIGFLVLTLLIIFALPSLIFASDGGSNLITNGDFISGGLSPWIHPFEPAEIDSDEGNTKPCVLLDSTNGSCAIIQDFLLHDHVDITKLSFSFDFKPKNNQGYIQIYFIFSQSHYSDPYYYGYKNYSLVYYFDENDNVWHTINGNLSSLDWTYYENKITESSSMNAIIEDGYSWISVSFWAEDGASTYVDNIKLEAPNTYTLDMEVSPEGSGAAIDLTGKASYPANTVVDIEAEAAAGYKFSYWYAYTAGQVTEFGNPYNPVTTFTMPHTNCTVEANFVPVGQEDLPSTDASTRVPVPDDKEDYEEILVMALEEPVRTRPLTVWQINCLEDNRVEFIFIYPYKDNNWLTIYDINGNEVYRQDISYKVPRTVVSLPDGMYTVRTFHSEGSVIQEFTIGLPCDDVVPVPVADITELPRTGFGYLPYKIAVAIFVGLAGLFIVLRKGLLP